MANVHIKTDARNTAEAATLREFGIQASKATSEQREMAAQITADNHRINNELNRMEGK